jgi:hypothetical protein
LSAVGIVLLVAPFVLVAYILLIEIPAYRRAVREEREEALLEVLDEADRHTNHARFLPGERLP